MKTKPFVRSMKVAFFLAVKAISRGNVGVTVLTVVMLVLANLSMMFVPSLIKGLTLSANKKLVDTNSSNIIIEARGDNPFITKRDELIAKIESIEGVTAVTYRNSMGAEIKKDNERVNCMVFGVSPGREKEVFTISDYVFEGSYLNERDRGEILLGVQLAGADRPETELYSSSLKHVHAGDRVTVSYTNGVVRQYKVKGIFYCQFVQTDIQAFVTDVELSSVNQIGQNRATSIHVKITDDGEADRIIDEIAHYRNDLRFQTWDEVAGIIESMTRSFALIEAILTVMNLLVAGVTVFIVTYVDLVNKRRQIGIERAIGITPSAIVTSYVIRALFYAIVAVILSLLLYKYVAVPLELRYPFRFPFGDVALYTSPRLFGRVALIITVVAIVAALIPTWRTMRIKLLEAIWG